MKLRDAPVHSRADRAAAVLLFLFPLLALWWWVGDSGSERAAFPANADAPRLDTGGPTGRGETLARLDLELAPADLAALTSEARHAVERDVLEIDPDLLRPARVSADGRTLAARVRLKGDLLDHVDTERFSLRIALEDGSLFGLRRFSIQHPKTRHYLREWLIHRAAQALGLLAPRSAFVLVSINGESRGIYFLEEHFDTPLLESQGRRDGPIVKFDESEFWRTMNQYRSGIPDPVYTSSIAPYAKRGAFSARRLSRDEGLARQLVAAVAELQELQRHMQTAVAGPAGDIVHEGPLARRRAEIVEDMLDVERMAAMHALQTLFVAHHGTVWHNARFYFDPVAERLEPIVFDCLPGARKQGFAPIGISHDRMANGWIVRTCRESGRYRQSLVAELARVLDPDWLEDLFAHFGPELEQLARALSAAGDLPAGQDPASIRSDLEAERIRLAEVTRPEAAIAFDATLVLQQVSSGALAGTLLVEAWTLAGIPVVVEEFRLPDGRTIAARDAVVEESAWYPARGGDGVCVAELERTCVFRAPLDPRLVNLSSIQELLERLEEGVAESFGAALEVTAVVRLPSETEARRIPIRVRPVEGSWRDEGGLPEAPTLEETLERHPFLAWDPGLECLMLSPGRFEVDGDLVLPRGVALRTPPRASGSAGRVVLAFGPDAVCVTRGALELEGVSFVPRDEAAGWAGFLALESGTRAKLTDVVFRAAREIRRGGWQTTGGVTFYHQALAATDCVFADARGEDALNVFGARVELLRCRFEGSFSDAFDGDFVEGWVRESSFVSIGADAVDFSGSRFEVSACTFEDAGDKCVSVGEESDVVVRECRIGSARFGVVSKDRSRVEVEGVTVERATVAALAAYQKKPYYGPAELTARGLVLGDGVARAVLVQTGSAITLEGVAQPTETFDVTALYATEDATNR